MPCAEIIRLPKRRPRVIVATDRVKGSHLPGCPLSRFCGSIPLSFPAFLGLLSALGSQAARAEEGAAPTDGPGAPPTAAETARVDRIVALVGDRLILASDVRVEEALAAQTPSPISVIRARQQDPLAMLIDAAVIRGLAGETSVYQPSPAELRARLEALGSTFEGPAELSLWLRRSGMDEDRLRGLLYSRLVVERYVQRNVGLPSSAAAEDEAAFNQRYLSWIEGQRRENVIRIVPAHPLHPDDGAEVEGE